MKNFRKLYLFAVAFGIVCFMASCGNEAQDKAEVTVEDSLKNENAIKEGKLNTQEQALQDFVNAFNEIQTNLNEIKAKEKIVNSNASSGDVKSKEDQIKEDIQSIYELMAQNKAKLNALNNSLNKKLKNASKRIEGLEQLIANLEAQVNEKDGQINSLKNHVEQLNIELSNLNLNYEELAQEAEVKTEKLNTAFYAIGTMKELKEKGVVTKEGGFIGLGKTAQLKSDFNKDYFTKVDITQVSSIPIGAKKIKILTNHPGSSYKLIGEKEKPIEKIEINNAEDFWSSSKYLVIVLE